MKAFQFSVIPAATVLVLLAGCASGPASITADVDGAVNPWTNLEVNNGADTFQFAIVADRTGSARPGVFEAAIDKVNLLQPEFVMCVGDLIQGATRDNTVLNEQWDELDGIVGRLEMPFFYTVGNHDIGNPVMAELYRQRLGRPYYHFVYKDVLFLVLCTEDGKASQISDAQVEYFQAVLDRYADARWTMLFMHKPMWAFADQSGLAAIETALGDRPYTVFGGHHHTYTKYVRNDRSYIKLATSGAASRLAGPDYGQVDQIVWVTMTDTGPRLANVLLDGIHDENMVTEQTSKFVNTMAFEGVSVPAVVIDGDTLTATTATVKLTNIMDVPIRVAATVAVPDGVAVTPDEFARTLAAGAKVVVPLKITAPQGIRAAGPSGIVLNWTAVADLPDKPQFTIKGAVPIGIEPQMTCAAVPGPITLDGKLDDWGELPFELASVGPEYAPVWSGATDGSLRFAVAYDDEHLYVAARVTDEEVQSDPSLPYWQQDGVEIWIDPRPRTARLTRRVNSRQRVIVGIRPGVTDNELKSGIRGVSQITDGGYTVEFAIPLKVLSEPQGGTWDGFRLNVAQFDRDGEANSQLWWRPPWRSSDNYIGSGPLDRR